MNFWLKYSDTNKFKLPVTPEEFEISVSHVNTVVNVVSLGDINLFGKTGLQSITLESFFPAQNYNFSKSDRLAPMTYVNKLESWRKNNTIIRFIIADVINMQCSIESFKWGEKDGTGDIYYTLSLKEYRTVSVKKISTATTKKSSNTGKKRTVKVIKATTHKIKKGDTLAKIAKKYYGSNTAAYRNKIYNANKKIIKSKYKLIVGRKIKIPALTIVSGK